MLAVTNAFAWGDAIKGNGDVTSESRKVSDFKEVELSGGFTVTIKPGAPSLTIETDRNVLEYVKSEVKEGRLVIEPRRNTNLRTSKPIIVTITVPSLDVISAAGGIDLNVEVPLGKRAMLDLSGGVDARIGNIDVDSLKVEASGGVELTLIGKATSAKVELSGGVQLHAAKFSVKTMALDASGGCGVDVAVADSVRGDISGGVDVQLHGAPHVDLDKSGGASVRIRN